MLLYPNASRAFHYRGLRAPRRVQVRTGGAVKIGVTLHVARVASHSREAGLVAQRR